MIHSLIEPSSDIVEPEARKSKDLDGIADLFSEIGATINVKCEKWRTFSGLCRKLDVAGCVSTRPVPPGRGQTSGRTGAGPGEGGAGQGGEGPRQGEGQSKQTL